MPQTLALLIIALRFLASPGAGILASRLFPLLRDRARDVVTHAPATPQARVLGLLFLAPRYSRITVLVLAQLFAILFAVPLALAEGNAVWPVLDMLVAALLSQVYHAFTTLSPEPAAIPENNGLAWNYSGPFICRECGHHFEGTAPLNDKGDVFLTFCPNCGDWSGETPSEEGKTTYA